MASTEQEEFNLNDLSFLEVIDGLNKYFAEDETRVQVPRSFVEVKGDQKPIFYRFDAEKYLDKLIAWLRTEHGIFYYPGMEAKYAKIERIPPLTERLMDEGALNSLKKLHKRVTGEEPEVDSHTLIADSITHQVSVYEVQIEELKTQIKVKESGIEDLKEHITLLEADLKKRNAQIEELKTHIDLLRYDLWDSDKKDNMDHIRQEASLHGYNLPEKVDGEPLTIERVFHDLLELMRIRGEELRTLRLKCDRLNDIVKELNTLNDEINE